MNQEQHLSALLDLASQKFSRPRTELSPDVDMFDMLGIDSVDAMSLLTALEERFSIEIPDYEIQDVRTFRGLADVISRRV